MTLLRYLPLLLAPFLFAWPPVMIRWLGLRGIDVYSQNLLRVAASGALFLSLGYLLRREGMKEAFARWPRYLLPAALIALAQTFLMVGVLRIGATFSMLIGRTDIILTVLVGVLFFADERRLATQRGFLPALLLALAGVTGVVLFRGGAAGKVATEGAVFIVGVVSIALSVSSWVAYGFSVKLVVGDSGGLVTLVMVNVLTVLCQIPIWLTAWLLGLVDINAVAAARTSELCLIMFSGVIGMAGGLSYIRSVQSVGVTVSQTGVLALPLFIAVVSHFWLGESLTRGQWASGVVLLSGLGAILYLEGRMHNRLPPPVSEKYNWRKRLENV